MWQLANFDGTQEAILPEVEYFHAVHSGVRYVEPLASGIVDDVLKPLKGRYSQSNGNDCSGCFRVAIVLVYMHARGNVDGFGRLNNKTEPRRSGAQCGCGRWVEGEIDVSS